MKRTPSGTERLPNIGLGKAWRVRARADAPIRITIGNFTIRLNIRYLRHNQSLLRLSLNSNNESLVAKLG